MAMAKKGIPAVEMVTANFLMEAKLVARSRGLPSLPIVVLPRNIELLSTEELEAAADKACIEIADFLTHPARKAAPVGSTRGTHG